jgi:succinate-acetate transporter protein
VRLGSGDDGQHQFVQEPGDAGMAPPRVYLRPIGSPLPLGFLGLCVATSVVGALNLGWIPSGEQHQVGDVLIFFSFPLQLVCTLFGFLARDAVVSSGIGVQAGTWLTVGVLIATGRPGATSQTLAFLLFVAAAALASAVAVAASSKIVPALVMGGTLVRYVLTALYEHFSSAAWERAAGWEGLGLAVLALYAAVGLDVESVGHRVVGHLLLRRGAGRAAMTDPAAAQVAGIEHEAGVRRQL